MTSLTDFKEFATQMIGSHQISYENFFDLIKPKNEDFSTLLELRQSDLEKQAIENVKVREIVEKAKEAASSYTPVKSITDASTDFSLSGTSCRMGPVFSPN